MYKCTYDTVEIAKQVGIYSHSGKPHFKAVDAIIGQLHINSDEQEIIPFQNEANGKTGTSILYTESIIDKVDDWLCTAGYEKRVVCGSKVLNIRYKKCGNGYIERNRLYH